MTTKSYIRGHEIEFLNNEWVYCDKRTNGTKLQRKAM